MQEFRAMNNEIEVAKTEVLRALFRLAQVAPGAWIIIAQSLFHQAIDSMGGVKKSA